MATKISTQNGIIASYNAFVQLNAKRQVAFGKLKDTLTLLVSGHNEFEDRISALEKNQIRPFPSASSRP